MHGELLEAVAPALGLEAVSLGLGFGEVVGLGVTLGLALTVEVALPLALVVALPVAVAVLVALAVLSLAEAVVLLLVAELACAGALDELAGDDEHDETGVADAPPDGPKAVPLP